MEVKQPSKTASGKRLLRDYIRLVIAFFAALLLLSTYQQVRLYEQGALDTLFNTNLLLHALHQLGFAALCGLLGAFVFNILEGKKPGLGFRISAALFTGLLLLEAILTEYFIDRYELVGSAMASQLGEQYSGTRLFIMLAVAAVVLGGAFRGAYRLSKRFYQVISNLYPATIILFSLFLATLLSEKRPVNRNKTQYILEAVADQWSGVAPYSGEDPNPFWRPGNGKGTLGEVLELKSDPPHIVMLVVEGLGSDFVGSNAPLAAVTPFMDSLRQHGLFWSDFMANSRESSTALVALTASLPLVETHPGIHLPARHSLYALLKKAGYRTSFQYGGNSALFGWDRYLYEERIDELADRKAFPEQYQEHEADAAGISTGFPDQALFQRYLDSRPLATEPRFDVFQTLSSKPPYRIPDAEYYEKQVGEKLEQTVTDERTRRVARRNKSLLAAMHYTDQQLREFMEAVAALPEYRNTLFVLTGSHRPRLLGDSEPQMAYGVPLLVFGPLVSRPMDFQAPASHLDVAPTLAYALAEQYSWDLPKETPWMGGELPQGSTPRKDLEIPLMDHIRRVADLRVRDHLLLDGKAYGISSGEAAPPSPETGESLASRAADFQSRYEYVWRDNALVPNDGVLYPPLFHPPQKKELVWIHSVFSGSDFDKAYSIARDLAFNSERERARLLCRYILSEVPGHVDTEILLGRIHAWEGRYAEAQDILEQVVNKYPVYEDGYAALLDVYHWAGKNYKASYLAAAIQTRLPHSKILSEKLMRASGAPSGQHSTGGNPTRELTQTTFQ
ncbi:sulfatase-like hydrolase/transferase [Robiginitalea sediminis]|uniref:sulfatase-like hydrolase/transferase n=1 Tax=Robiginitalea sediminis TaxID=1982593 RepID=UPI000B4BF5B2|nr:sulfatase-like hydrolase/transferase [Robiginitalea sediminis]